ncbi:30S ribosomal protein S20 [candidate division KSB1 bacterium]|nr:30S ribosomal protein S20 [candidate division KSB1 bacterium]
MPHHKSAIKRLQTNAKRNEYNTHYRSKMRSTIKNMLGTTEKEKALSSLNDAYSLLDKLVKKNIIHRNKAAHQKARLAKHVNSL